ncbi:MAG: penicillin-binding protein activator LpoB [Gammaproteobacteria bacterium SG8_47]|nr:MAG: penicillin-binding protein activator LpoB [Gammaproteobacteria bacterium SG8_47]
MHFRPSSLAGLLTAIVVLGLGGCATEVTRIETDEVRDLSGAWNDTDSQLVSQEMINQMLDGRWLPEYQARTGTKPTVIVGEVRNLSHEHINVNTFIADIERAVINSGRVTFVASSTERLGVRDERKDQDVHAREDTRKPMGQEIGADFMLGGTMSTIIDRAGADQVRYYQIDLTLISLADNTKVWVGQKKIKKFVERSQLRY